MLTMRKRVTTFALWAVPLAVWCWWNLPRNPKSIGLVAFLGVLLSIGTGVLGFLKDYAPEDTGKDLKEIVWGVATSPLRFLSTPSNGLSGVIGIGIVASLFVGSVEVRFRQSARESEVFVFTDDEHRGEPKVIEKSSSARFLRRTWPWSLPYRVKAKGYPAVTHRIFPWYTSSLVVPRNVSRPVVLLRPSIDLHDLINSHADPSSPPELEIEVDQSGRLMVMQNYDGEAVWIGCDEHHLPDEITIAWQSNESHMNRDKVLDKWKKPASLEAPYPVLGDGSVIEVTLKLRGVEFGTYVFNVKRRDQSESFVRERVIHVR